MLALKRDMPVRAGQPPALLSDTIEAARAFVSYLRIESRPEDLDGWIDLPSLCSPDGGPSVGLNARFVAAGFGANRKAVAGSLMLRYGWAAGFAIAAYMARKRVILMDDFALKFSPMTLVEGIWVRDAEFLGLEGDALEGAPGWAGAVSQDVLRREMLASLIAFTAPLIDSQHRWSGFSRHALWSMVVSSWGAQFASVGEALGDVPGSIAEARAIFALDPDIQAAAPDMYEVTDGFSSRVCQRRAACCIYFKGPRRQFCASCPILSREERLASNLEWVRKQSRERGLLAG